VFGKQIDWLFWITCIFVVSTAVGALLVTTALVVVALKRIVTPDNISWGMGVINNWFLTEGVPSEVVAIKVGLTLMVVGISVCFVTTKLEDKRRSRREQLRWDEINKF
jgi:hypothetical protein